MLNKIRTLKTTFLYRTYLKTAPVIPQKPMEAPISVLLAILRFRNANNIIIRIVVMCVETNIKMVFREPNLYSYIKQPAEIIIMPSRLKGLSVKEIIVKTVYDLPREKIWLLNANEFIRC